jgi:hypothetical protein
MFYGGQKLTVGTDAGLQEAASQSTPYALSVTTTPATNVPFTPLPTAYWQTPVNAENVQNWYAITGPWLGLGANAFATTGSYNASCNYNPYTLSPTTGHILWTKPWAEGGVAGGDAGNTESSDYWITSQYEPKWAPVVINGIMYSTWYTGTTTESNGIMALNLFTGQTMWVINTTNPLICGMDPFYQTINEYGIVGPYIWTQGSLPASQVGGTAYATQPGTTQWNMYDGLTGNYICSIVNGTTLSLTLDANQNLVGYYINSTAGTELIHPNQDVTTVQTNSGPTLNFFNFTEALSSTMLNGLISWLWEPALNHAYSFMAGVPWCAPIPAILTGTPGLGINTAASNVVIMTTGFTFGQGFGGETNGWLVIGAFNAANGALLWVNNATQTPFTRTSQAYGDGVMVNFNEDTFVVQALSMTSGTQIWTQTLTTYNGDPPNPYDEFNLVGKIGPGVIFFIGFGGDIWDVNLTNGNIIWYTNTTTLLGSSGTETPYGVWPLWVFSVQEVTNNILYVAGGHEYDPPLFHGNSEIAINETNGQLVWNELSFDTTGGEISYGILSSLNSYDGQVYAYGQGPSKTTVSVPEDVGTAGSPMVITGTVTDVSAGTTQQQQAADFPNGVPCVSDASQSAWMAYIYMQQPEPTNVVGVPVTLTSIDPNGNTVPIGTTTSNAMGTFAYDWSPPIPGNYTIIATFAGSGAYYGSYADTYAYANSAPSSPAPTSAPVSNAATASDLMIYMAVSIIVIIIAIAIVGLLILRKHA